MAIIQMGAIVAKISGKIGGQTAALGRNGQYIKNTGSYKKTSSNYRRDILSSKRSLEGSWGALNAGDRLSWDTASTSFPYINRVGDTKYYSGYQLYCKFNGNLLLVNETIEAVAPLPYGIMNPSNIDFNATPTSFLVGGGIDIDTNCKYAIFVTNNLTQGQQSLSYSEKLVYVADAEDLVGGVNLISDYMNRWGRWVVGGYLNIRIKAVVLGSGQADDYYWQTRIRINAF